MIDKEFVLVSQGIEIYRTKSQENAVNMVKEYNDEYFDYLQKCYDNYERPADNYVDLEIEYSNEKEKDKEIERLNKNNKELTESYHKYKNEVYSLTNIIIELEKWLNNEIKRLDEIQDTYDKYGKKKDANIIYISGAYNEILDKLQELKENK